MSNDGGVTVPSHRPYRRLRYKNKMKDNFQILKICPIRTILNTVSWQFIKKSVIILNTSDSLPALSLKQHQ